MAAGRAPRMPEAIDPRAPATCRPGSMTGARCSASRCTAALRPRLRGGGPEPHEGRVAMLSPSLPSAPAYAGAEGLDTGCVHGHQRSCPTAREHSSTQGEGHA